MGLEDQQTFPLKPGTEPKSSEMKSRAIADSVEAPYSRARGIRIRSADLRISFETFWWGP